MCETVVHGVVTEATTPKGKNNKIVYIENGIYTHLLWQAANRYLWNDSIDENEATSKVYAYTAVKKDSYQEDSFGNHQAASYMKNATQIRGVKAKLDTDSIEKNTPEGSPLESFSLNAKA